MKTRFTLFNERQQHIIGYAKEHETFKTKDIVVACASFGVQRITLVRDLRVLEERGVLEVQGKGRGVSYAMSPGYRLHEHVAVDAYFSRPLNERGAKPVFEDGIFALLKGGIFSEEERKRLEHATTAYTETRNVLVRDSPAILRRELERLLVELSWKSSEIEGNTYTLLETEALLNDMRYAEGKDKADAQMILNHKRALDHILARPEEYMRITLDNVTELHGLLVADTGIKPHFRDHPVGITGTLYRPPARERDITAAMRELVVLCEAVPDPIERAFLLLIMVSYIQPFEDGNKRTARIIANAHLFANGRSMLSYRNVGAVEYKKAMLLFYEQNNISYIKELFVQQYEYAVSNYFAR